MIHHSFDFELPVVFVRREMEMELGEDERRDVWKGLDEDRGLHASPTFRAFTPLQPLCWTRFHASNSRLLQRVMSAFTQPR